MADEGVDEIASNNHHSDLLLSDCSNNHTEGNIQNNDCAITAKNETKSQLEGQGSSNNVRQGGLKSKNNTSDLDLDNTADLDPAPITDPRSDASMEVQHLELTGMREDDSGINVETASPSKSEISDTDVTSTTDSGINIAQQSDPESISIAESIKLENEASDAGKIDIFLDNDEVDDDDDDDLISSVQTLDHHSNTSTPVQSKVTTAKVLVLQDIDNATKSDNKTDRSPNTDSKRGDLDPETADQGQPPSVSQTSDINDGMLPDMVDTDDSNPIGQYDFNVDEEMKVYRKQKRDRRMSTSSSSDDDLDDLAFGKEDDAKFSSDDEDEDKSNMDLDNSSPLLNNWHALGQLRQRELGVSNWKHPRLFAIDCHASLYMVQKLQLQYKMEKHDGCVNALHFNETGTRIASGSDDLQVILWNWMENKPALAFDSGHRSNVFQAKFMPYSGDAHIVTCARDGQVRLAELSLTGVCKETKKLAQHKGAAHKLSVEYDSPHVFLSCGEDAVIFEMDLRQDKANKIAMTKENDKRVALYSIHANPMNSFEFCVGGRDHFIRIYDKRKINEDENGIVKKFCPHHLLNSDIKANVTCAVYNYNGTEVLGTYNDEDIYLFDATHSDGAEYIHKYKGHRNNATVKGVNFYGPRSEYVIGGSDCSHVFLWDKATERVVQYMEADEGGVVNVLEPHPHAPFLATSGLDHNVKIWAPTAEEPTKLEGLKECMKKNSRERERERTNEPDMDGQMMWFLMHHLRRTARRRARQEGEDVSESSSDADSTSSDSEEEARERLQCMPS